MFVTSQDLGFQCHLSWSFEFVSIYLLTYKHNSQEKGQKDKQRLKNRHNSKDRVTQLGVNSSTSLRPPSFTDDTATLVRMPILNLIFKPNNKVLYKINVQAKTN